MYFAAKRVAHLSGSTVKFDQRFAIVDPESRKPLRRQPIFHSLHIGISRAKLLPKLLRRQPGMKLLRTRIQLLRHELLQRGLLRGAALQQHMYFRDWLPV